MELHELLDRQHTAVLVLGLQNDYCSKDGALPKWRGLDTSPIDEMVKGLKGFLDAARASGVPVAWVQLTEDKKHMADNYQRKITFLEGDALELCAPGTWGYKFYQLSPKVNDRVFADNQYDGLCNQKILDYLKEVGAKTLVITGVYTSRLVDTTVRSAASRGYDVFVPIDLVAAAKEMENEHVAALTIMNTLFAYVVTSDYIIDVWKRKEGVETPSVLKKFLGVR